MYRSSENFNFNFSTVRATWEARKPVQSPAPKSLLAVTTTATTPLTQLPNGVQRLSSRSFTMFNSQFNLFRSKASRGRQSSSHEADQKPSANSSLKTLASRKSSTNIANPTEVNTGLKAEVSAPLLPRSRTTSFLPVPTKPVPVPELRPLVSSKSTASLLRSKIPRSQIPNAPKTDKPKAISAASRAFAGLRRSSSSYLQRSATQPNLRSVVGRKASEFPRQTALTPTFASEVAPLLESEEDEEEEEEEEEETSSPRNSRAKDNPACEIPRRQNEFLPARLDSLQNLVQRRYAMEQECQFGPSVSKAAVPKEEAKSLDAPPAMKLVHQARRGESHPSPSNHVVQVHHLLSPIQPKSPHEPLSPSVPWRSPPLPPPTMEVVQVGTPERLQTPEFAFKEVGDAKKPSRYVRYRRESQTGPNGPITPLRSPKAENLESGETITQAGQDRLATRGLIDNQTRDGSQDKQAARKKLEVSPSQGRGIPPAPALPGQVFTAQASKYWCGRYMSTKDRLLNGGCGLYTPPDSTASFSSSSSSIAQVPLFGRTSAPEVRQALEIFDRLDGYCMTQEAKRSLAVFRNRWAVQNGMPFVAREIPVERRPSSGGDARNPVPEYSRKYGSLESQESTRKLSFMEKLKMRGRKSSGKSEKSGGITDAE